MRIAFLSGGLEPDKDGVGDYTRSLAQEITRKNPTFQCKLVALNDPHIGATAVNSVGKSIELLRLPPALTWQERTAAAKKFLDEFEPDWVSLQFVSYAFHHKGIVHGLKQSLLPLTQGRHTHIMFHELWLGDDKSDSLKHKIVGAIQKRCIADLYRGLAPKVVHTSNESYMDRLLRQRIEAVQLPLFGNIPIADSDEGQWLYQQLNQAGIPISPATTDKFWLLGFFGALHPEWSPEPLFEMIKAEGKRTGRRPIMISAGKLGGGESLWQSLSQEYAKDMDFVCLGPQSGEHISFYLQSLDVGIATSPVSLIGKSGTVAAMVEHGLPVIINRNDTNVESIPNEPLMFPLSASFPQMLQRGPKHSRLPEVAAQFLSSLSQ